MMTYFLIQNKVDETRKFLVKNSFLLIRSIRTFGAISAREEVSQPFIKHCGWSQNNMIMVITFLVRPTVAVHDTLIIGLIIMSWF